MKVLRNMENKKWIVFNEVEGGTQEVFIDFGNVTYKFLNVMNMIFNGRHEELLVDDSNREALMNLVNQKDEWSDEFKKLDNYISSKELLSINEKISIWKSFSSNMYKAFQKAEGNEIDDKIVVGRDFSYIGYELYKDEIYERFRMLDVTVLFYFDLKECLFGRSKSVIQKCRYCGDYFITENRRHQYCDDCKENYGSIRYHRRKEHPIDGRIKKIKDLLGQRVSTEATELLKDFNLRVGHYKDRLKDPENAVYIPKYDDGVVLNTDDDLIKWLDEYREKIRIR